MVGILEWIIRKRYENTDTNFITYRIQCIDY